MKSAARFALGIIFLSWFFLLALWETAVLGRDVDTQTQEDL
jgi:hypothetical protein